MYSAYQQAAAQQQQQSKQNYSDMFGTALTGCSNKGISHKDKQQSSGNSPALAWPCLQALRILPVLDKWVTQRGTPFEI